MKPRAVPVALALALGACVAPARSFEAYRGKAAHTAESVASAVETARLAVKAALRSRIFPPSLSIVLSEAEDDAGSAQGTFDSVQPPDGRSDALREDLDDILAAAVSSLSDLRIAARRRQIARLEPLARPLGPLGASLERFAEENG